MTFWFIIFGIFFCTFLCYQRTRYSYWTRRNVEQLKPHFLLGHIPKLKGMNHKEFMQEVYDSFKGKQRLVGVYIFTKPVAVILDLDLVKAVLIKDFNNFASRMTYKNEKDILSQHLFNVEAELWRPLRTKFSPTFTSGKIKFMFPTVRKLCADFLQTFEEAVEKSNLINVHYFNSLFTVDVIGTCFFGIECNSLKDPEAEFLKVSSKIFSRSNFNVRWHLFKQTYVGFMKFMGFKRFPQFVEDFFRNVVCEGFKAREKQQILRNDFVDILIDLKKSGELNLSYDQISAQLFIFFTAGFETSSTSMSYALFELAKYSDTQNKLRQDIWEVLQKHNHVMSYEALMDMKYLDCVLTETLRMYPPLPFLQRVALNDYKVHGTDVIIEKNTEVFIPAYGIHYDPNIFDNPKQFQPERFLPGGEWVKSHPQSFLGFGDGPRNCIALRFGRMITKLGLISLLTKFKFSQPSTKNSEEIEFSNHSMVLVPKGGVYLKVEKI
ncbi:cytochrome P450 6a8-like [Musca autumnalis]|uniref:cytochrome P450 6a8-like n=1 Tax=Musca autumnalis TaxID=221902 RepID=UPI003CE73A57